MKNFLLSGLLFLFLVSCEKNPAEEAPISGTWVETTRKADTLVFNSDGSSFMLNRGSEMRNGLVLPKYLSGPYSYEIAKDSVYLKWMASSRWDGNNYYFNVDSKNQEIRIGNFFVDSLDNRKVLIFSRIR
ncbi:hypothetical protein [Desertivirga arenae]|uniref:hypothetical protein n=1 Tax=Desertivirga arenae TaxID=2810309 RepID=UPI001A9575E3|nr:hypothetical protein [Pedobacter sp. SYSU D00823]